MRANNKKELTIEERLYEEIKRREIHNESDINTLIENNFNLGDTICQIIIKDIQDRQKELKFLRSLLKNYEPTI